TTIALYIGLVMTSVTGVAPVMLTEMFPTKWRYTGVSTTYQLAQTVGSGFSPLIATSLLTAAGGATNTWPVGLFLVLTAAASIWAVLTLPDRSHQELDQIGPGIAGGLAAPSPRTGDTVHLSDQTMFDPH
ncbi:MAG TPA: MFS transporter, partial [Mycobacterium sp.]|nr:MFS transporter [Mycobacterium sp.]